MPPACSFGVSQVMLMVKNPPINAGDIRNAGLIPGWGRFPVGGCGYPAPVLLPGESHGQRTLVGYSPWDRKALDMTEGT